MSSVLREVACNFAFPRSYELKVLESYALQHPLEKLHQFPAPLDEADRNGTYIRVVPANAPAWVGFFALGFDSQQVATGIYSCPAPECVCVVAGGYGYIVNTSNPQEWLRVDQQPVVDLRIVKEPNLLLFAGFTSISAYGESGHLWTTERLSWEGLSLSDIREGKLHGLGWNMLTDKEVAFEVELKTGKHRGGARP